MVTALLPINFKGGARANVAEFMAQTRFRDIMKQVADVNYINGQSVILDTETGDFYLINAHENEEIARTKAPLGQIDVELEEGIFRGALQLHKMYQLFGDCSPENPIVLEERSGRVYAQNNPTETRGFVELGGTVHCPSSME